MTLSIFMRKMTLEIWLSYLPPNMTYLVDTYLNWLTASPNIKNRHNTLCNLTRNQTIKSLIISGIQLRQLHISSRTVNYQHKLKRVPKLQRDLRVEISYRMVLFHPMIGKIRDTSFK